MSIVDVERSEQVQSENKLDNCVRWRCRLGAFDAEQRECHLIDWKLLHINRESCELGTKEESVERMKKDLQDFQEKEIDSRRYRHVRSKLLGSFATFQFNSLVVCVVLSLEFSDSSLLLLFMCFNCLSFFSVLCFNDIAELEHHSRPVFFRMSGRVCLTRCYQCFFISFSHSFSDEMKWLSREKSPLDTINNFQFSQFPSHSHKLCHRCCSRSLAVSPKNFIFIGVSRELGTAKMASILSLFGWA